MKAIFRCGLMIMLLAGWCALTPPMSSAQTGEQTPASQETGELILQKCSVCHDTGRICASLGRKDLAQWQHTVVRMHGKGAKIGAEQVTVVAQYLTTTSPGTTPVCTEEAPAAHTGPLSSTLGKVVLLGHPALMAAAILLAFATLRLGFERFRSTTLGNKAAFDWKKHTKFGYTVLIVWLAGMAAGSSLTQIQWGEYGATGQHRVVAYYMFPLILFGLGTGYLMDKYKKPRKWLPILHGLGNTVLVLLSLWQAKTGIDVVFGMIF